MKVFLASSYKEFRRTRSALIDVIERLGLQTIVMEKFGASATPPADVCIEALSRADLVVALFGGDYGASPPGDDRSFTHIEVETALERKRPIIAYVPAAFRDRPAGTSGRGLATPYVDLLRRLGDQHTVKYYSTLKELRRQAHIDIVASFDAINARLAAGEVDRLTDAISALDAGDLALARRLLFGLANAGDARAQRWLGLVELLSAGSADAVADSMLQIGEAGAAGDPRAQSIVRAMATCSPGWIFA